MTTAEGEFSKAKTSVWWDIENCEVPKGWDAHAIAQNVSSALLNMNYGGPVSISAYGDTNLIPHAVQQALSSTGVGLNHVPAGVKDASDKKILVDMLLWAVDNPAPANFMLISGDRDFSNALHQLSMRRYTILLAQPPRASAPLVAAAKNVWLWTSLASGGPPLTSAESSRLVNSGRGLVSNHEASKDTISEQTQSSKSTVSTSVSGDTKDQKIRENHVPTLVPQDKSRGATGESVSSSDSLKNLAAQHSDKRHTSQAGCIPSQKTQASVKAKPVQEAKLLEPVLCSVCQISCASKDAYIRHTYGKRHRNNLELQCEPNGDYHCRLCNVTCQRQVVFDSHLRGQKHAAMLSQAEALIDSKKHQEKIVQPREAVAEPKPNANYACRLCNVVCQSQIVFDSHLRGQKHASMLSQSKELNASKKLPARETIAEPKPNAVHVCRLCNVKCHSQIVFESHLRGQKHAAMLSQSEALIDSKKLQEKGVGEKDQPRETTAQPQLQSQHAQDSSKCFEKHVAMVNQSEALVNSRNLEEKVFGEKDQPVETNVLPQSQSQNTQVNTKFFEKSNEEFTEIIDISKNSVKEKFPSTRAWVEAVFLGDFGALDEPRECVDGIVKPVNLSEGATEKETDVMVHRAIAARNKICDSQGLSTVVCDIKDHWTKQTHITPAFIASDGAKSCVSTKPITTEPEVLQPVWCQVCQISCSSKVAYANHTYGEKHIQNLELQSAKNEYMSRGPAKLSMENPDGMKNVLCQNQISFDYQNHAAMVKEQTEVHVDSRRARQEFDRKELQQALIVNSRKIQEEGDQEKETTEEHTLVKTKDHVFQGTQENKEEVKEINHISGSVRTAILHAFTELNQESSIPKESRGCLDVIPEKVQLPADGNVTKKLEDEPEHKPLPKSLEPEKEFAGRKELPGEAKVQVDNFWTRLWGKKN